MSAPSPRPATQDEFAKALRACLPLFWTAVGFAGGVNLLFLASPLFLLQIYNRVIPSGSIPTLFALGLALLIALLTMVVLDSIRARILVRAAARLNRLLAPRLFQAVTDSSLSRGAASRSAQPMRDLDAFRSAMAGPAAQLFFDAPWSPLFLLLMFLLHPLIGLVGVLGAGLLLGLAFLNDAATREDAAEASAAAGRSYAFADSVARYADPVHAMGMADALHARWQVDREDMMIKQRAGSDRSADLTAFIRFCRLVLQGLILSVGAWLVIRGAMLPASIFASSLLLGRALSPLEQAVIGWRQMALALVAGRNVQRTLSAAPPQGRTTVAPAADASVVLEGVTFIPGGAHRPALRDIDLTIASGETVGLVGASGAGKSCLARLVVAASLPTAGRVSIGCVPTGKWTAEALSRQVGFLPQNVGLFPGSIRDNISRFREASDEAVLEAARRANVHELILDLPDGYDTLIGEGGAGLSGGQRQRVALARALFGSPRLLVLDEPNAHLDADGDAALETSLKALRRTGTTIIIVAHRLNPLAQVDRVLMLNKGELKLDGPRKTVIEQVPTEVVEHFARP